MEPVIFFRLTCLFALFIFRAAAKSIVIEPSRLVVKYGDAASATCSTTEQKHEGIGWEASQGAVEMKTDVHQINWTVSNLTHWDLKPYCYINSETFGQQQVELAIIIYKLPDSVDMKTFSRPVKEGETYLLQCNIKNVAPVQYLRVMWYKQRVLLKTVTFNETTMTPVDKNLSISIQASRYDDGAKYWCEAKLHLGPEGPQPPPTKTSEPQSIVVQYEPLFANNTETIESEDSEIVLNCTVKANPPPKYSWQGPVTENHGATISVNSSGNFSCNASNEHGQATKLFIVKFRNRAVFWVILGIGLLLASVLIVLVIIKHRRKHGRTDNNGTRSPAVQKEEGEELVSK